MIIETVGVRALKSQLSMRLGRVKSGVRIVVTDRGRPIATIAPIAPPAAREWAIELVASGHAHWSGGRPTGARRPVKLRSGSASAVVIEDRR